MVHVLGAFDPAISNGVMAVGTAALAMLLLAAVGFSLWAVLGHILRTISHR